MSRRKRQSFLTLAASSSPSLLLATLLTLALQALSIAPAQSPSSSPEAKPSAAQPPAAVDAYRVAPGDRLAVAISFRPAAGPADQKVEPGDELGFFYHFAIPEPGADYKAEPGDKLNLYFTDSPELSQLYVKTEEGRVSVMSRPYLVQPDGTLVVLGLDSPIPAAGQTTRQIQATLAKAIEDQDLLDNHEVFVSVEERQDMKHNTLRELFQPEEDRPVSYPVFPVPADGKLSLPLLDQIKVTGRTIKEISDEVTTRYHVMDYYLLTANAFFVSIADQRHRQLRDLLNDRVHPFSLKVLPSGTIAMPLMRSRKVAGKTVDEISDDLTQYFQKERGLNRVEVSVWLEPRAAPQPK